MYLVDGLMDHIVVSGRWHRQVHAVRLCRGASSRLSVGHVKRGRSARMETLLLVRLNNEKYNGTM